MCNFDGHERDNAIKVLLDLSSTFGVIFSICGAEYVIRQSSN